MFVASENWVNELSAAFLIKKILPAVRSQVPSFRLLVAGSICEKLPNAEGLIKLGRLDDLSLAYRSAQVAFAPLFWGTGQNVKIVEAMSLGLPIVTLNNMHGRSHIRDGESGCVAADAEQFVEYTLRLLRDEAFRDAIGGGALRTCYRYHSVAAASEIWRNILADRIVK
ncbi:glycosyltransferase family 4 protein [Methylobacterium durans]|uniref:glycosyltransferase family 4 protein n=1 Tax=Methylobacterium durans TaxID=2202825 RepID=UPI003AAA9205